MSDDPTRVSFTVLPLVPEYKLQLPRSSRSILTNSIRKDKSNNRTTQF